jgi:hypothetical protein
VDTYRAIGKWFFEKQMYDSAAMYYNLIADNLTTSVSISTRPLEFCAEYYSANVFSSMIHIRQRGIDGWNNLAKKYRSARTATWPLSEAQLCSSQKRLEKSANDQP